MRRIVPLALLLTASAALAGDWPQWLGPNRDGTSSEVVKPWKGDLKVLWRKPAGPGHSSPVVAGGKVYLFAQVDGKEEEALHCFDARDGKEAWVTSYPRPKFWTLFGTGPQGTPTVSGGRVFTFGPTGIVTAFDAARGEKLWQVDTEKELKAPRLKFGAASSPLVDDGKVIVNVGARGAGVVAFSADKGKVVWKSLDEGASYASAIKANGQYIVFTQDGLRGLSPSDGKKAWEFPFRDKQNESSTTPMFAGDILLGSSITLGMVGLERDGEGYKQKWKNADLTCYFSTPVPLGKHVYVVTGKIVLLPTSSLHCVEADTGKVLWTKEKVGTWHAAMLRTKDDKLLLLTDHGDLALIDPSPKEYKELARTKVTKVKGIWAHPALSDGKVYLRDDKELICIQLPE
jgi:outer membrane protein assembly factor BamB